MSYRAPLGNSACARDGICYWIPGVGAMLQDSQVGRRVAGRLRGAGFPAITVPGFGTLVAAMTTVTTVTVAALELGQWRREVFHNPRTAHLTAKAIVQCTRAQGREGDILGHRTMQWVLTGLLSTLPLVPGRLAPFDLDDYLRAHFTKVGPQTRELLERWARQTNPEDSRELHQLLDGLMPAHLPTPRAPRTNGP